ncbi:transcriptional repressor [Fodinisporobacter ferrooxydans]|uniref:Transcriptional repressor n=1 Tax=Fodinisporobacter ferrooxydans TaxID=2901836 RepID=A0ABY4CHV6_9BACL|nr:transcriptional repressor [Alicyclobacillaceae bacterium MYW30-H2]
MNRASNENHKDMEQVTELLHQQNFRLTRERAAVLELFMQADQMLTPIQLYEYAQKNGVEIGLTTVYRLLEVLTKVGLCSPFLVDGVIYYTFCIRHHHHHFVCLACQKVQDIFECPSFQNLTEYGQIKYHKADMFGYCTSCQKDHEEQFL